MSQAILGRQGRFGGAIDNLLALTAVFDQIGDRDDLQPILLGHFHQGLSIGSIAGIVQNLAQDAARPHPRQTGEVDHRLGMAGTAQDPPFFGLQRKDMPGADKIGDLALGIGQRANGGGSFLSGDPRLARDMVDGNGEGSPQRSGVVLNHLAEIELSTQFGENRHTDHAAAMGDHKVNMLGGHRLGGADQIPLIFPIFVVHNNDQFTAANRRDCLINRRKPTGHISRSLILRRYHRRYFS